MNKKVIGILVAVILVCSVTFVMCQVCNAEEKTGTTKSNGVKVNNEICPVSGDKVNMKDPVTAEYKGEIYNFCCPMCIAEFNKHPEKYSAEAKKHVKAK